MELPWLKRVQRKFLKKKLLQGSLGLLRIFSQQLNSKMNFAPNISRRVILKRENLSLFYQMKKFRKKLKLGQKENSAPRFVKPTQNITKILPKFVRNFTQKCSKNLAKKLMKKSEKITMKLSLWRFIKLSERESWKMVSDQMGEL